MPRRQSRGTSDAAAGPRQFAYTPGSVDGDEPAGVIERDGKRQVLREQGGPELSGDEMSERQQKLHELKARCLQFGVDATDKELIVAGLLMLAEQTETALEVAILKSLRADRSFRLRKSQRK